jgi:acetyl-CoA synthetase
MPLSFSSVDVCVCRLSVTTASISICPRLANKWPSFGRATNPEKIGMYDDMAPRRPTLVTFIRSDVFANTEISYRNITYNELAKEVSRIANVMKLKGVRKGDVVTIYMPMIPELPMVMLACARIGAIHSIVFAGFSAESLKGRIVDCNSKFVFVADEGKRGGRVLKLKETVDQAVSTCPDVQTVFVWKRTGAQVAMAEGRDVWMEDLLPKVRPYCPCELMDSEDTLFILYTSGSTGKPKGVAHTTAGYLLNAALTTKESFDLQPGDIYCCVADCGWITGHSYIVYGPLCNGTTTVMFESVPTYPNPYR